MQQSLPTLFNPRFRLTWNTELLIEWSHGGGFRPALLIWRWRGQLVAVVQAGQA